MRERETKVLNRQPRNVIKQTRMEHEREKQQQKQRGHLTKLGEKTTGDKTNRARFKNEKKNI